MKIILREPVDHLGERGEIVSVAAGYARNYLLPKGLAYAATPGNLKQINLQRKVWAARDHKEVSAAETLAARIGSLALSITMKAGESGTLYGSVTNSDIAELLAAQGVEVDRRRIVLDEPIKTLGERDVQVRLHSKVTAQVKLQVIAEESAEA